MSQFIPFVISHWVLWSLFVIVIILLLLLETRKKIAGVTNLDPQELVQLINRENNAVIIDVRPKDAYRTGHILGAQNIPAEAIQKGSNKLQKYKTQPVIIVCATGAQSQKSGAQLKQQGFSNIYHLKGGMQAWRGANLPVVQKK
jgi:rhodanese-related sulfurtransferase